MKYNKTTHKQLYNSWRGMRERCNNPNNKAYKWYGKLGITVTKLWSNFHQFATWALANGYKDGLTIDRTSSKDNYTPDNCTWITHSKNVIDANQNRYRSVYEDAHAYWVSTQCSGVKLGVYANKSNSITSGWIRGWKANNMQLVPPGEVTKARSKNWSETH